jgi:SAM-dependent methyltransferase
MGFPDGLRADFEDAIWADMLAKLPALAGEGAAILDIGPGCGGIARRMIALAEANHHHAVLIDHQDMLDQLPVSGAAKTVAGRFPDDIDKVRAVASEGFDVIIAYSLLHIVTVDANPFAFVDAALSLLKPGGRFLIGDIPNVSKLRRFLASDAGAAYHRAYMRTQDAPEVPAFALPLERIDDGLIIGLVSRARQAGFDAYWLPQPAALPLANRREDVLIERP